MVVKTARASSKAVWVLVVLVLVTASRESVSWVGDREGRWRRLVQASPGCDGIKRKSRLYIGGRVTLLRGRSAFLFFRRRRCRRRHVRVHDFFLLSSPLAYAQPGRWNVGLLGSG